MPSFFYHLAFELHPEPLAPAETDHQIYLPPPDTNIFTSKLPTHSVASWGTERARRPTHRRTRTDTEESRQQRARATSFRDAGVWNTNAQQKATADTIEQSKRSSSVAKDRRGTAVEEEVARDWRFDSVTLQSIDMVDQLSGTVLPNRPRGKSQSQEVHADTPSSGLATRGRYIPSDPKNTEVGWGVVHLYRDARETPGLYDDTASSAGSDVEELDSKAFDEDECTTVCILAVPSYMTPSDLLGFVGEQTRENVSHFRLVRTGRANKYMVLMKFRQAKKAKQWQKDWNGRLFNSMEPEYCHVVFVQSITFQTTSSNSEHPSSFPNMTNDPFTPQKPTASKAIAADPTTLATQPLTTKPLAPPTPNLVELPTCPVCLERMDETTGLLTILCQHVFHCACLEKWRGTGCPVCRYTQNGYTPKTAIGGVSTDDENQCSVCASDSNLWICLICGNVGCGRYDAAHAFKHYEETGHAYAMDIATQHVWDYVGDGYVHRLIQNKADGKLVDLPAASAAAGFPGGGGKNANGGMTGYGADMVPREKMEAMGTEYAYLLTSQLDSQRRYFEEQLERAVDKAAKASSAAEQAAFSLQGITAKLDQLQASYNEATAQIKSLEKDMARAQTRSTKSDELARKVTKDWREEKTINESLLDRVKHLDSKIKDRDEKVVALEVEKRDLEEQNRDLSFFIEGRERLREMQETEGVDSVVEGKIEVPEVKPQAEGSKRKKGRRK